MSRVVSGVFGATATAPSPSSQTKSKSTDLGAEAAAFSKALGHAQTKSGAAKKAAVSDAAPKSSASKTGKAPAGPRSPVKKVATQEEPEQTKVQKKAQSDSSAESESSLGDDSGETDAEPSGGDSAKGQKKNSAVATAAESPDTPAAIVQFQAQSTAQDLQPTARNSPKQETGSKNSPKAATTTSAAARPQQSRDQKSAQADSTAPESSDPTSDDSETSDVGATTGESELAIQPRDAKESAGHLAVNKADADAEPTQQTSLASTTASTAAVIAAAQPAAVGPAVPSATGSRNDADDVSLQSLSKQPATGSSANATAADDASDVDGSQTSSASQFSDANHPRIVSSITGRLLPNGGSMQIRLDPPELGAMQVRVEMRDGAMSASFETSNDQATRLLSHSLGDLRTSLAAQGVNVEKLQVTQSPKQQSSSGDTQKDNSQSSQDTASQREQQRKEMVRRMWQKLMGGSDPIDMVA